MLEISKGFNKVWHQSLMWKLKHNETSGNMLKIKKELKVKHKRISGILLKIIKYVLASRYQRVVLNWKVSKCSAINARVS